MILDKKEMLLQKMDLQRLKEKVELDKGYIPPNITGRMNYWHYYYGMVMATPKTFFIGNAETPDRSEYPSAHNYYLDYLFNFGFLAFLPMLIIILTTFVLIFSNRKIILSSSSFTGLCFVTLFLLLIDNSLKVGLKQPYSGIFTFFLWGVLLNRLYSIKKDRNES